VDDHHAGPGISSRPHDRGGSAEAPVVGLLGMRERVELHDGRLTVESRPDAGTTLRIEIPL
jgi:signal transduction histidine kinase